MASKQNLSAETLARRKAYNAQPDQIKKRAMRNAARAEMMDAGLVRKGDGKDVGHLVPLDRNSNKGANSRSNLAVQSQDHNRGWKQGGKKQP